MADNGLKNWMYGLPQPYVDTNSTQLGAMKIWENGLPLSYAPAAGAPPATVLCYALVGGAVKAVSAMYVLVGGVVKPITGLYTLVGGVVKQTKA